MFPFPTLLTAATFLWSRRYLYVELQIRYVVVKYCSINFRTLQVCTSNNEITLCCLLLQNISELMDFPSYDVIICKKRLSPKIRLFKFETPKVIIYGYQIY